MGRNLIVGVSVPPVLQLSRPSAARGCSAHGAHCLCAADACRHGVSRRCEQWDPHPRCTRRAAREVVGLRHHLCTSSTFTIAALPIVALTIVAHHSTAQQHTSRAVLRCCIIGNAHRSTAQHSAASARSSSAAPDPRFPHRRCPHHRRPHHRRTPQTSTAAHLRGLCGECQAVLRCCRQRAPPHAQHSEARRSVRAPLHTDARPARPSPSVVAHIPALALPKASLLASLYYFFFPSLLREELGFHHEPMGHAVGAHQHGNSN